MKTILEIFYLRIMDDKVHYQRKEANLSEKGEVHTLPLKNLRKVTKKSRRSRSLRHIAFLIRTDQQNEFESALTPETKRSLSHYGQAWLVGSDEKDVALSSRQV